MSDRRAKLEEIRVELVGGPLDGDLTVIFGPQPIFRIPTFRTIATFGEGGEEDLVTFARLRYDSTGRINDDGMMLYAFKGWEEA